MKSEVTRMCFICRNTYNKKDMLRLVKTASGEILIDRTGKASGRGAYICSDPKCIEQIKRQKVLNRAFKCEFPVSIYTKLCEELIDNKRKID